MTVKRFDAKALEEWTQQRRLVGWIEPPYDDYESRLVETLKQLTDEYQRQAQPILDALEKSRAMKAPKIFIERGTGK